LLLPSFLTSFSPIFTSFCRGCPTCISRGTEL
jgi:hypothetical protein